MNIMKITEAMHIDRETEAQANLVSSIAHAFPAHCHDYFEFFLIVRGRCVHRVNGCEQHLTEGSLVFIRPADVHSYDYEEGTDCSFMNVAVAKAAVMEAFGYLGSAFCGSRLLEPALPVCTILSPLETDNLKSRCEKLQSLSAIDKPHSKIQARSIIIEIFSQYFSGMHGNWSGFTALWLEMLMTQMQKKENFTAGLKRMQELSGRSAGHLNRVFRRQFHVTPTEYINRIRLSYAKTLIINTSLGITSIAMEAGFENLSHFNHLFRKYFGVAPTGLRAMAKNP